MIQGFKISDSNPEITRGSRADNYWQSTNWEKYYQLVRPNMKLPKGLQTNDPESLVKKFHLAGIGFGNWVNLDDRMNYLRSLAMAMYDINKVLRFNYNIGMDKLAITFGARGSGSALAHYEPGTDIINITRYSNGFSSKYVRFFGTGGMGSLAHEYGHFLDYFSGAYLDKNAQIYSLSNGDSVSRERVDAPGEMRKAMDDLMEAIIWKIPGKTESNYYKRLIKTIHTGPKGDYWKRRNEIFARAFEAYVQYDLGRMGIKNHLLTSFKYTPSVYLKTSELKVLAPKFEKLITLIRKAIKA